ncbi:hypothetical protein F5X99DRAFT_419102 [Biscogniauxia marginata]|nr:hypothetical protein F5X99DRAFT_419102 [Biscogniauxia marginata]
MAQTPSSAKGKEPATATRPPLSQSTFARPQTTLNPSRSAGCIPPLEGHDRRIERSSTTWTSSSAELNLLSEGEEVDDRAEFVYEYNRLAKRYGIRLLVEGDFSDTTENTSKSLPNRQGSWISRVLRQDSSGTTPHSAAIKQDQRHPRHRRSISDATVNLIHHQKKHGLQDEDLAALVRLCGKSIFYLPTEYAPCSLVLPTCFRALAQALVQKADSRGIFRVPGSLRVVNALYEYYCADKDTDDISSTTRCPTLPTHIKCGVHDIASTFKRLLAGLPGGILGSLSLFDALVAIHSQLRGDPELNKTKETKLRARLIALAIGTVKSRYQRELICSVFGLLCLAGRAAENAPREDEDGRPLPTADLMGYNALGIVFGPLLIGGLINSYSMKVADPSIGLVLLPVTPPTSRKERKHKKTKSQIENAVTSLSVDKIHIANSITEMLITHWREVVRHMRSLGSLKTKRDGGKIEHRVNRGDTVRSSASDSFPLGTPPDWNNSQPSHRGKDTTLSPRSASPAPTPKIEHSKSWGAFEDQPESLSINRQRSRRSSSDSPYNMLARASKRLLSPTVEESPSNNRVADDSRQKSQAISFTPAHCLLGKGETIHATQASLRSPQIVSANQNNLPATNEEGAIMDFEADASKSHHPKRVGEWKEIRPSIRDSKESSLVEVNANSQREGKQPTPTKNGKQELRKSSPDLDYNAARLIRSEDAFAGRAPLRYDRDQESNRSITASHLVQRRSVDETPRHNRHLFDKKDNSYPSIYETASESHGQTPPENLLHGGPSFHPYLEEFPSYHDSGLEIDNRKLSPSFLELTQENTDGVEKGQSLILHGENPPKETFKPKKPPSPSIWYSNKLDRGYFDAATQRQDSVEKWKAFARARASTEALAKSAKERRMTRNTGYGLSRQSRETLPALDKKLMTPEWRPQPVEKQDEEKQKPLPLSPERKSMFEGSPQTSDTKGNGSPCKANTSSRIDISRPLSYRSTSRPVGGAVKAMAALFDNNVKDSPAGPEALLTGTTLSNRRGSTSGIPSQSFKNSSLTKYPPRPTVTPTANTPIRAFDRTKRANNSSERSTATREPDVMVNRSHLRHKYSRSAIETPTKFPYVSLRPTGPFTAARKVPQASPAKMVYQRDRELSRPPSLGTMVPHSEAPPVAQHMNLPRPSPSPDTSPRAQNVSYGYLTPHRGSPRQLPTESPRSPNANSLLYAQIRHLQRHSQAKDEELLQLRRQLETRENLDIGTISEELRKAKRECKMWRERAEAAEKRVAVLERFTAQIRGRRETEHVEGSPSRRKEHDHNHHGLGVLDNNSSSSYSEHTENQEVLKNRIRGSFKENTMRMGGDGTGTGTGTGMGREEDDEEVFGSPGYWRKSMPCNSGGRRRRRRSAELWDATADEFLDLEGDTNTRRNWGALEGFE